jgi:hypothetical protein
MRLTNEWIEQGLQQGRQEARDLVVRLLRRRLRRVPVKLARQIARLDDRSIFELGDSLFDFSTPADVQRWLTQRNK